MKDYYKEFSLDKTKSSEELLDELFKQRKKWMQRQNASSMEKQQEAKEKVKLIDEAQETFATESSKKAYDEKLERESAPKPSSTTSTSSSSQKSGSTSSYNSGSSGSSSSYNSGSSSYKPEKKKHKRLKRLILIILLIAIAYYKKDLIMKRFLDMAMSVPKDAVEWNGHYYKVYDNADSWEDARLRCEKKGGHLVTITSAKENDFVYSHMVQQGYAQAYIGLYNASYSNHPIWTWVTEERFKYKDWGDGEPNNYDYGYEYYGEFLNGAWNDCSNTSTNQYICEWDSAEGVKQDTRYIEYKGHIYEIFSNADGWTDAKERAEKKGGYLACITSAKENAALLKLMRRSGVYEAYFGLFNNGQNKKGYTYKWVSGEKFVYEDWAPNQPDNYNNNELYGGFFKEGGQWNDFTQDALEFYIVEWNQKEDMK